MVLAAKLTSPFVGHAHARFMMFYLCLENCNTELHRDATELHRA